MSAPDTAMAVASLPHANTEASGASLLHYLRTLWEALAWKLGAVWLLMLLTSLTESLSLLLLVPLLELIGLEVGSGSTARLADLVSRLFAALSLPPSLPAVLGIYVAIVIARALLARFETLTVFALWHDFVTRLRLRLFHALTDANWLFFSRQRSSDLTFALTGEFERIGAATANLLSLVVTLVVTLVYVGLAVLLSPLTTLLVLACGGALLLALKRKTRLARARGEAVSEANKAMYATIQEHLAGMKVSKSHATEAQHLAFFAKTAFDVKRTYLASVANHADVAFWFKVGSVAILAAILYVAVAMLELSAAGLLLMLFIFSRLIPMFSALQSEYQAFVTYLPAFANVVQLQARCEAASEPHADSTEKVPFTRELRFEQVSFSYRAGGRAALHELELVIRAHETTAIVGPSGAGKSTLADLLVGLITPDRGRILVDGKVLGADALKAWRRSLAYVPQDPFLFHASVRDNLLAARPDAQDHELLAALRLAAADELVARLPHGLDTSLGDRGMQLSGGERQRLVLARALLRNPSLLVLDEATSALDGENEQRIMAAIDALRGTMTIVVISHRLSTVRSADVIHVLEGGSLVESGSYDTLMRLPHGRFRRLYDAQETARPSVEHHGELP